MPGRRIRDFQDYLTEPTEAHVSQADYLASPATAFLKYTVEAKSAIDLCIRTFTRNNDGNYRKDSLDSLQHLVVAMLPAIMGHFETFQRYLFAGSFDLSVFLSGFDIGKFFKELQKEYNVTIDPIRLSAYRHIESSAITSIGVILADNLSGWHNPEQVNKYFGAFSLNHQLYSREHCKKLRVLWQLRHSIVHTGGTLTLSDAQKVADLADSGDSQIAFEDNFVFEVSRKLHPLVRDATEGFGNAFKSSLLGRIKDADRTRIQKFFEAKSSIHCWL